MTGLISYDRNLSELMKLYGATHYQTIIYLKLPSAIPYFLCGLQISCCLSLTGAVIAELTLGASSAGPGLAYRIIEAAYRLNLHHMLAATILLAISGLVLFSISKRITRIASHYQQKIEWYSQSYSLEATVPRYPNKKYIQHNSADTCWASSYLVFV